MVQAANESPDPDDSGDDRVNAPDDLPKKGSKGAVVKASQLERLDDVICKWGPSRVLLALQQMLKNPPEAEVLLTITHTIDSSAYVVCVPKRGERAQNRQT